MATEALASEQTVEEHVEEVKLTNDVKDINKETIPESKDVERKDDEEIKVENSVGAATPATNSETDLEGKDDVEIKVEAAPATNLETDLGGKDDEEIKVEDSVDATAPTTNSETSAASEENQEDSKSELATEEVKKEDAEVEKASNALNGTAVDNDESFKQEVDSSTTEPKEEADSGAVQPAVEADVKEPESQLDATDIPEPLQPSTEALIEISEVTLVQQLESETAREEAAVEEVNTTHAAAGEEANTIPEAAAEEVITSPEAKPVEVNTIEELPQVSSVSVTEGKEAETPVLSSVTPVTEPAAPGEVTVACVTDTAETSMETTESQKEEPLVTDMSKLEEVSDNVPEAVVSESTDTVASETAPVKELKEEGQEATVTEEVSDVLQLAEVDHSVSSSAEESVSLDANPVSEPVEISVTSDVKAEETQEEAVVAEEPSDTTNTDATPVTEVPSEEYGGVEKVEEKKEAITGGSIESLKNPDAVVEVPLVSSEGEKGEKPTMVETSRGIDIGEGKDNVNTEAESLVSEETEKDEKTPVESEKDAGEAPKSEVSIKSSQRQSNNIFSKVKQSIVKVKKAIIGKSPSSKTMTVSAEGKDDVKVK